MSTTGLEVFDETVHKTTAWLKEIAKALGLDRHGADQVLRAVLHSLRDRLIINEAAQLGDQSPCWSEASITRRGIPPENRRKFARVRSSSPR
jgi:uncharacterized protein (DUF2267 family)